MPIELTSSGYIEVHRGAEVVSRHRVEREAIESCLRLGSGDYVLTYPTVRVTVSDGAVVGVINGRMDA
jgi:DUF917 family protein